MQRINSLDKTLLLGKIEGRRRRERQRMRWLDGITNSMDMRVWVGVGSWWWTGKPGVLKSMGSQRVAHDWVTELTDSDKYEVISHSIIVFICIYLIISNTEHHFMCLLVICILSLKKCLLRSSPHVLSLFPQYCIVWAVYILWKLNLCRLHLFFFLWWILSYIEMKQPSVYMCSPSQSPLPPPSPPIPSRFSQCTRSERSSHASNLGWWSVSP